MTMARIGPVLVAGVLTCGVAGSRLVASAADTPKVTDAAKQRDAAKKSDDSKKPGDAPSCMHCGATCGLRAVCICEPGTKKRPKTEFDATCEPICIPGCGGPAHRAGCTDSCTDPCACPGRVRWCKKIVKETVDEEVPTVVRKVRYVCDRCTGRCGGGCCGSAPQPRSPSWWTSLPWWWPRAAGE